MAVERTINGLSVRLQYSLTKVRITPDDLFRYDKREKKGLISSLLNRTMIETMITPTQGEYLFTSREIRRAVDIYAEEFCLNVEDTLTAFWAARQGSLGFSLPIWLQNSSSEYTTPAMEAAMGEAVAGYLMERVFDARLHHRPRGRSPDIYMRLPNDRGATVEAKASVKLGGDTLHARLAEALFDMLTIWAHIDCVQKLEDLDGFCIGVAIGRARVEARVLRLEYQP